jgi:hypothetical protein
MGSDRSTTRLTARVTANTHTPRIKSTFTANIFVAIVDIAFTPFSSGGRRDESFRRVVATIRFSLLPQDRQRITQMQYFLKLFARTSENFTNRRSGA